MFDWKYTLQCVIRYFCLPLALQDAKSAGRNLLNLMGIFKMCKVLVILLVNSQSNQNKLILGLIVCWAFDFLVVQKIYFSYCFALVFEEHCFNGPIIVWFFNLHTT